MRRTSASIAPSTMALSAYNAMCVHGDRTAEAIAERITRQGGTSVLPWFVDGALQELERRGLVARGQKAGEWGVLDPLRRVPFSRDRAGSGWALWMVRDPMGRIDVLTDESGMRVLNFDPPRRAAAGGSAP